MFVSAGWPMVWTGFLLVAVSVRLAATARLRRSRRLGPPKRGSRLEWLPGLLGLLMVVASVPRVLGADSAVVSAADQVGHLVIAAAFALLLYGVVVLARRGLHR